MWNMINNQKNAPKEKRAEDVTIEKEEGKIKEDPFKVENKLFDNFIIIMSRSK